MVIRRSLVFILILFLLSALAPLLEPFAEAPSEALASVLEAVVIGALMLWLRIRPALRPQAPPEPNVARDIAWSVPISILLAVALVGTLRLTGLPDVLEAIEPVRRYTKFDWLVLVTLGPLLEELFLRQVVYDPLRRRGIGAEQSALYSGIIGAVFQIAGLAQGRAYLVSVILQATVALIQGPLYGRLRERTHSILPSALIHALYNGVYLGLTYWLTVGSSSG